MLFCVSVGDTALNDVEPGFHQVWEANDVDELMDMIWDHRCEWAEGDFDEDEEEWGDFVERNSTFHFEEYDPTNKQHVLCTDYLSNVPRPEHQLAVDAKEFETRTRIRRAKLIKLFQLLEQVTELQEELLRD